MNAGICPECEAIWKENQTCQDDFYQMLHWEAEDPANGEVHHLMVLCYHMQHPRLYSPETLERGKAMLRDFLQGVTPQEMRQRMSAEVDSGKRKHKITGTPEAHGQYARPVAWTYRAADVVAAGIANYRQSVRAWSRAVYDALVASGNAG